MGELLWWLWWQPSGVPLSTCQHALLLALSAATAATLVILGLVARLIVLSRHLRRRW